MKKALLFAAAAAILAITSCQKEEFSGNGQGRDLVFTATIDQTTRTNVNAQTGAVTWVLGDEVTITDAAKKSAKYVVDSIDVKGTATFKKLDGQPSLGRGPYAAVYGTDPAMEQAYSTAIPSLPMSAESDTTVFNFSVSCCLLEITANVSGEDVCRIIVQGQPDDTVKYKRETDGNCYFTLICSTPESIGAAKKFYIAVPAGKYSRIGIRNSKNLGNEVKPQGGCLSIEANQIEQVYFTKAFTNAVDIHGKSYPFITINGTDWLADNFACDKYDTESEVYTDDPGNHFKNDNYFIPKAKPSTPTYKDTVMTPYFTDATDRNTWSRRTAAKKQQNSLTDAQVARFGYLYNWAAAVGVYTDLFRTTDFTARRQGICPNGWHVPSQAELDALKSYIEGIKGTDTAGSHLKSTSGWYDAGNPSKYPQGVDTYYFDLLPAGFAAGDSISNVGAAGHVLTSSPGGDRPYKFYYGYGSYTIAKFPTSNGAPKANGRALRCIRNK